MDKGTKFIILVIAILITILILKHFGSFTDIVKEIGKEIGIMW